VLYEKQRPTSLATVLGPWVWAWEQAALVALGLFCWTLCLWAFEGIGLIFPILNVIGTTSSLCIAFPVVWQLSSPLEEHNPFPFAVARGPQYQKNRVPIL
jgi:hypothetical protein